MNETLSPGNVPLLVLWRRKWIVVSVFLVFAVGTGIISKVLPKTYAASSTLIIAQTKDSQSFDAAQAAQVSARTYADVISSPNIEQLVAQQVGGPTPGHVGGSVSFQPVAETALLKISAEDASPQRARAVANAYANVFIDYARTSLLPTTKASISLADAASLPGSPAKPKPTLYTVIAALFGLALGLGLAFLRDRLDTRLRSVEELESAFELPILGRLPRRGRGEDSAAAFQEAFRVLRTNLQFAHPDRAIVSVAITSTRPAEGKTTTAAQLGAASAEVGSSVLLVDADLHRQTLPQELIPDLTEPLRPGLTNYLVGAASVMEIIHATARPKLSLVPFGPVPPNPSLSWLLESRRGRTAIADLAAGFDFVAFDCPPLSVGVDASVIAGRVDGVILMVDLERTSRPALRDALRQLDKVNASVLGLVVNRDREGGRRGGYGYGYGYGYASAASGNGKRSKTPAKARARA